MTDTTTPDEPTGQGRPAPAIRTWSREPDAWRWNRRLTPRFVDTLLRVRSATILPASLRDRITIMGIPPDIMEETLHEIRRIDQWTDAWIETAQRFLGDYRRQISGSQRVDASLARMLAGYCYHIAQLAPGPDPRTIDHCRATAATLIRQALPDVAPLARRLDIPWRTHELPAILIPGPDRKDPSGLVVMFNGTSTTKEELLRWTVAFSQAGQAVLVMDTPGTGEARHLGPPSADHADLLDGMFDMLRNYHAIDLHKVGLVGVSLGGNIALRCLAHDRRIAGAAVVTPPYEPARWITQTAPLVQDEMRRLFQVEEGSDTLDSIVESFALTATVPDIQRPTLVFGGGRDVIVPPGESTRLAAALGPLATLAWYADGEHALYRQLAAWTIDAANWLNAVQHRQSTRVDDLGVLSQGWRAALDQSPEPDTGWDESMESARLLSPEEVEQSRQEMAEPDPEPPREHADEYSRAFDERPARARSRYRRTRSAPPRDESDQ